MIGSILLGAAVVYGIGIVLTLLALALLSGKDASGDASLGVAAIGFFWPYALFVGARDVVQRAWRDSKESADGKILTRAEFQALLNDAIDSGRVSELEVRRYVGVSKPSLDRWRQGLNAPHPAIRRYVIDYVHGRRSGPITP